MNIFLDAAEVLQPGGRETRDGLRRGWGGVAWDTGLTSHAEEKKEKKEKTGPKRPLSAYMFYVQDARAELVKENPGVSAVFFFSLIPM